MRPRRGMLLLSISFSVMTLRCDGGDGSGAKGGGGGAGGSSGSVAGGGASGGGSAGAAGTIGAGGAAGSAGSSAGGSGGNSAAAGAGGNPGLPSPTGVGGAWTLVWNDEFDGTSLDLSKWHPNWYGATDAALTKPVNDVEASCYDPAQVKVSGGVLELTAVATTKAGCVKKDGSPAGYASGLVMSDGRYNFTFGFVETRIWLPPGTGTPENWAAFWVNGKQWPQDGEIDVMETLGGGSATRWTYHYDSDPGAGTVHSQITAPQNNLIAGAGWHLFGAHWQADKITFYYDGKDVGSFASGNLTGGAKIAGSPHYFIANHGLNVKYPDQVPSTLKVDYVRHWQ